MRVVIAEDSAVIRAGLAEVLADRGHQVVAGGGLAGLAERLRTVDGTMEISSPRGGPSAVTVELPSHA